MDGPRESPIDPELLEGLLARCYEQQQAAEGQGVRAHHPLQVLLGEVQGRLDRRQGDVDDRHVEDDQELGRTEKDQGDPLA